MGIDRTKIIDAYYTDLDSQEVRRAYYDELKKHPPVKRKIVVTEKEWAQYRKAGADMSRFVLLKELRKVARQQEAAKYKERTKGVERAHQAQQNQSPTPSHQPPNKNRSI